MMLAIPMDIDLFSGSTNLKMLATQGIADIDVNQMVTNRHNMKTTFCKLHSEVHCFMSVLANVIEISSSLKTQLHSV